MVLRVTEDIRTVSELKQMPKEILAHVKATSRPLLITVNGKAHSVILDVESYERLRTAATLSQLLARGEEDISNGRMTEMHRFFQGEDDE